MKFLITVFFIFLSVELFAQQMPEAYKRRIQFADSLYRAADYKKAASAYADAFKKNGKKGLVNDRYHAAISYALSNNSDSAFYNLFRMADRAGWNNYELLTTDSNLKSLRKDERWNRLVNKVRNNKAESEIDSELK